MIAEDAIVATLKTDKQVASMRSFLAAHDPDNGLIVAPLCGELRMVLVHLNEQGVASSLTVREAAPLGLDEPALARIAFENLRVRFPSLKRLPVAEAPGLYLTRAPLASSTLILADLFEGFAANCRGDLLVVPAARDFVLSADSNVTGVLYELPVLAGQIQEVNPDPLSVEVFKWTPSGFDAF